MQIKIPYSMHRNRKAMAVIILLLLIKQRGRMFNKLLLNNKKYKLYPLHKLNQIIKQHSPKIITLITQITTIIVIQHKVFRLKHLLLTKQVHPSHKLDRKRTELYNCLCKSFLMRKHPPRKM